MFNYHFFVYYSKFYNTIQLCVYSILKHPYDINTKIFKLSLNTESSDTLDTDMGFYLILGRVYHNVWPHQDIIFFFSNGSLNNIRWLYANLLALHWFKSYDPSQLLKMLVTYIVRKSLKMNRNGVCDGSEEEVQGCWGKKCIGGFSLTLQKSISLDLDWFFFNARKVKVILNSKFSYI